MSKTVHEIKIEEYEKMIERTIFVLEHMSNTSLKGSKNKHYPQHSEFYRGRSNGLKDAYEQLIMEKEKIDIFFNYLDKSEVDEHV